MSSSISKRLTRLQKSLTAQSLDAMLIKHVQNVRYLCGFTGSAGVLIVTPDEATLYVDGRYTEQAQKQVVGAQAIEAPRPVLQYVLNTIKSSVNRLGFEANNLIFSDYEIFQELLPTVELVALDGVIERLRAIKDDEELALMQQAIDIADQVFEAFCGWIEPGMVESQVAARLEYEQRMLGGERNPSGFTIVASGARTALPHGVASDKVIGKNEPVMIDIGTTIGGYGSDMTRTVHLGKAADEYKEIYRIVYDAQQKAIDGIKAGITAIQADALARDVIEAAGHGDKFGHSLAHSIGLDVHERPLLNQRDPSVLEENMVFTIEPGIYVPGWGGVRIEDMVRVTTDGCEVLNNSARTLLEL